MSEWTAVENKILLSDRHLHAALEYQHKEVHRLALLEDDRQRIILDLTLVLDVSNDVLV